MAYQRQSPGDRSIQIFGGINVGDPAGAGPGTSFKRIVVGTFTANTSSIGQSSVKTTTFTASGATTGDLIFLFPSTALDAGLTLVGTAQVTATSQVTVSFVNETTAAVVQTSGLVNRYLLFKTT